MGEAGRSCLDKGEASPDVAAGAAIAVLLARASGDGGERILRCAACKHLVTSKEAGIEVDGAHEHTRRNPAGFVFRIGCFREAPGCLGEGPSSEDYSWFPGYAWQVGVCRRCGIHLGWVFQLEAARFYGLIVGRLVLDGDEARG
jgi:hypothetical protein